MVLGPAGHVAAVVAAGAGRAALYARRAFRALAQPTPTPALVAARSVPDSYSAKAGIQIILSYTNNAILVNL